MRSPQPWIARSKSPPLSWRCDVSGHQPPLQRASRARTKADLDQRLGEHLEWLRASAERYDARHTSEAKRMAVTIRSLVHDTPVSKSLLTQLRMRDRMVWKSLVPMRGDGFEHAPWIDDPRQPGFAHIPGAAFHDCDFDTWWRAALFSFRGVDIDRSWFVLHLANYDGGAHVDPALPDLYRSMAREGGLNPLRINSAGQRYPDSSDPVPSALRTICTEIVISIESAW